MPKYVVRFYQEVLDEFVVEATNSEDAIAYAEEYGKCAELPKCRAIFFAGMVEQTAEQELVGSGDTEVYFYREDGNYQHQDAVVKECR